MLEMIPRLSYELMVNASEIFQSAATKLNKELKLPLRHLAFKVAMKCEDLFHACKFRGDSISCCEVFKPIYSERGFCFSFNARYIGAVDAE